jgi:hypothetical protein
MAFNNYYGNYNPYQPQMNGTFNGAMQDNLSQLRNMQNPPVPNMSGAVWVQGEAAAKSYPVAPNNNVILMDSEAPKFYVKSADPSGMPFPLRVFEYKEVNEASVAQTQDMSKFVTKEELENILSKYEMPVKQSEGETTNV